MSKASDIPPSLQESMQKNPYTQKEAGTAITTSDCVQWQWDVNSIYQGGVDPYKTGLHVAMQEAKINKLTGMLHKLAEHLLIEKAKRDGLNPVDIAKLLASDSPGDRQIAIALVNDSILEEIINTNFKEQ